MMPQRLKMQRWPKAEVPKREMAEGCDFPAYVVDRFVTDFANSAMRHRTWRERLPVPYMELDGKARILRANRECNVMLDPAGGPVLGKSVFAFLADSDIKRLREYLAISRQSDKLSVIPLSIIRNGERMAVELRLRRQSAGSRTGYLAVVLERQTISGIFATADGTSKRPERLLHEFIIELTHVQTSKSVVETVIAYCSRVFASPAGMIFVRRDGHARLVSQWQSKHVSQKYFSEERIRNGPITQTFRTGAPIFWSQTQANKNVSRYLRGLLPGPRRRSVAFLPIRKAGASTAGVLAIVVLHNGELSAEMRDHMSQCAQMMSGPLARAGAYDEAIAARSAAEIANKRQADFLSVISHELRNPMTPILNWAVALSSGKLAAEKQSLALEAIIRNVRALNYLIDDLFDSARLSSGKLRLQPAEMRIQEAAREALAATQHLMESKKLRITVDISEGIPAFFADPRRVRQVLVNLLNNAVKFTPGGGSIMLKVARRGGHVECAVRDTGRGIAPDFLPFVFDRFRQENRSPKLNDAGLGLGLSIVREIVELHGGSVRVHSHGANQGATFIVRLPLRTHKSAGTFDRNPMSERGGF